MGTEISKLAIVLSSNSSGMAAGLKQGQAGIKSIGDEATRTSGILSSMPGILGAITAVFGAFEAFDAFRAQEQSVAKLDAVLRSTGEAAGFGSSELQKYAADLQQVTTFGDEATISAEAVLATFTNIRGDQFKDAIKSAQNLSTVLGQDLQSSVMQIGKALNDPAQGFTRLKRAGVSFTESQAEQIKTLQASGDIIGAQTIILGELEHEFGGAAEAVGSTFSGKVAQAKNALKDLAEIIVGSVAPGISGLANGLKSAAAWAGEHADAIRSTGKALAVTAVAVAAYRTALFAVTAAQKAWAAGEAVVLALQGWQGWAKLTAATVAATAGIVVVNSAFAGIEKSADAAMGPSGVAGLRQQMSGLGDDGESASEGIDTSAKAVEKLGKKVAEVTERLKEQASTFGMTTAQAEVYKLKLAGATDQELKMARAWQDIVDGQEAHKKGMKDLEEAAKKLSEAILDPWEKLEKQLQEVDLLERQNLITSDQAFDAYQKYTAEAARAADRGPKVKSERKSAGSRVQPLETVERRITAGFTLNNAPWEQKQEKLMTDTAKAAAETAKNTKKIADKRDLVANVGG